jgi:hypothetical protein
MSWQPMSHKTRARRSDASQSSQSSSSSQSTAAAAAAAAGTARARCARCAGGSELSTMNRNGCLLPELCFQMRIDIEAAASIQEADGGWLRLQTNARDVSLLQFRRQAVECRSARQALADGRAADASSDDGRPLYTVRQKQSCERRRVSVLYSTLREEYGTGGVQRLRHPRPQSLLPTAPSLQFFPVVDPPSAKAVGWRWWYKLMLGRVCPTSPNACVERVSTLSSR